MVTFSETLQTAISAGNPQRVLLEFTAKPDGTAYSHAVCFSNEDVLVSAGVRVNMEYNSETHLTIGLCPSAEIEFELLNDRGQLADFEFGTFTAWLGARIDTGTPAQDAKTKTFLERGVSRLYEFSPLGIFVTDRPDIMMNRTVNVRANDLMTLFDRDMPDKTALGITYPATAYQIASAMCTYLGVTLKTNSWLNSTVSLPEEPDKFKSATMRDVLGWIAEAGCSNARFSRDGKLEFVWLNAVQKTFTESDYSEFVPAWYETQAIDALHIRNADSTSELTVGTGSNTYMIQGNPFLRQTSGTITPVQA